MKKENNINKTDLGHKYLKRRNIINSIVTIIGITQFAKENKNFIFAFIEFVFSYFV